MVYVRPFLELLLLLLETIVTAKGLVLFSGGGSHVPETGSHSAPTGSPLLLKPHAGRLGLNGRVIPLLPSQPRPLMRMLQLRLLVVLIMELTLALVDAHHCIGSIGSHHCIGLIGSHQCIGSIGRRHTANLIVNITQVINR